MDIYDLEELEFRENRRRGLPESFNDLIGVANGNGTENDREITVENE